jgi:mevalonyl-CoA ligase
MSPNLEQQREYKALAKQAPRLSIIRGPSQPALLNITLGELTRIQGRRHSDGVAVISQHQHDVLTYSQLDKYSDDLAAGMIASGVRAGDRVAVMLGNRSEYVHVRNVSPVLCLT